LRAPPQVISSERFAPPGMLSGTLPCVLSGTLSGVLTGTLSGIS
jgi:hypothetical protein